MSEKIHVVENGQVAQVSAKLLEERLSTGDTSVGLVFIVNDTSTRDLLVMLSEILSDFPLQQEERINTILSMMHFLDSPDRLDQQIDFDNALRRRAFLKEYPALDATTVQQHFGYPSLNSFAATTTQESSRQILGLPVGNESVFPAFQFNEDGQPIHLVSEVLKRLPADFTPWQIAFWIVSPNASLDGATPLSAIQEGNQSVLGSAECERLAIIG